MTGEIDKDTAALEDSLRHEPDTGKFRDLLARTSKKHKFYALRDIATDSALNKDKDLVKENFPAKVALLYDNLSPTNATAVEDILISAAATGHYELFRFLLEKEADPTSEASQKRREKAFMAAAGAGKSSPEDNFAARNLLTLLETHTPTEAHLFAAFEAAIAKGEVPQVEVLANYAKENNPTLINQKKKGKPTLLEMAITKRLRREIGMEASNLIATALLEAGAVPPVKLEGIDIISLLEEESFSRYVVAKASQVLSQRGKLPQRSFIQSQQPKPKLAPKANDSPWADERKGFNEPDKHNR